MHEGQAFAVINENGIAFHIAPTYEEALDVASKADPDADVWYEGPPPWEGDTGLPVAMAANGDVVQIRTKGFDREPMRAMKLLTGLRPMTSAEIESVSLAEAHRALRRFFPTSRPAPT
jgi:hypothetical protein